MLTREDQDVIKHLEKAPPGLEPVVKALKKKSGVDNPYAVAWSIAGKAPGVKKKKKSKQALSAGVFSPLLRDTHKEDQVFKCAKRVISESARPIQASAPLPAADAAFVMEGAKVMVCLITEGLGNRRDMNFYGPEAMDSAPAVFEGAHCFLNHPSYSEERDIPERRVQDMCGYFKNVHVDMSEGVRSIVGELHFDLSDTGRMGYDKFCTALHYQTEFPGLDKEYVGLSVNASGDSEPRDMTLEGETVTTNYVTRFTEAMSCDIVTLPARGGKALALMESEIGATMKNKEVRTMIVKRLQKTQSALKEAMASAKTDEEKKPLAEALRNVESLLKDVLESQARNKNQEADAEMESDNMESKEDEAKESEDEEPEDGQTVAPGHKVKKTVTTTVHHTADGGTDDGDGDNDAEESDKDKESEAYESNRLAVKQLIQESGLKPSYFDLKELSRKGLKEAKAEIARVRRISEANAKEMLAIVAKVSPSHAAKLNESGKPGEKVNNNDLFAGCTL